MFGGIAFLGFLASFGITGAGLESDEEYCNHSDEEDEDDEEENDAGIGSR